MISFSLFAILFCALSTALGTILCVVGQGLTSAIAEGSFLLALPVSFFLVRTQKKDGDFKLPTWGYFEAGITFCLLVFCFRQFGWLYFFHDGNVSTLDASNFGDLPLHLTYIAQMVKGVKLWSLNPIFPYEKLHYPIGVDLFTAFFIKLGMPFEQVLPILGFIFSASVAWALLMWGRGFAVGSFLFSGGFAGFEYLAHGILKDYQANLAWKNIILTLFIPQRGFLLAFPAGLWLLWSWRQKFFLKKRGLNPVIEAVIYGTLPLFHFHTFIFMSISLLILSFFTKNIKSGMKTVLYSLVPATFFTLLVTENFHQGSLIWFEKGWLIKDQNPLAFFLQNYGLFFPLAFTALLMAAYQKRSNAVILVSTGLGLFTLFLFVMFAPWDWDNTKLMVWCYLMIIPVIDEVVLRALPSVGRYTLYGVFFFSGTLSVWSSYIPNGNSGLTVASIDELAQVCFNLESVEPTAIFAAWPTFGHPVSLCGNAIVAGYAGHLWSYGIKSEATVTELNRFMLGQEDYKKIAENLRIRYVFWGKREQKEYALSTLPDQLSDKKIAEGSWGRIFDLLKESK